MTVVRRLCPRESRSESQRSPKALLTVNNKNLFGHLVIVRPDHSRTALHQRLHSRLQHPSFSRLFERQHGRSRYRSNMLAGNVADHQWVCRALSFDFHSISERELDRESLTSSIPLAGARPPDADLQ